LWYHPGMQSPVDELFNRAADLPEEDRATLAGLLIESLDTEIDEGVEEDWQAEVQQRLSELDSGSVKTVPWESVRARILKRHHDSQS
jgi:putative addiction module component (TIGR02574 family)